VTDAGRAALVLTGGVLSLAGGFGRACAAPGGQRLSLFAFASCAGKRIVIERELRSDEKSALELADWR
jgi:hypothetical protein